MSPGPDTSSSTQKRANQTSNTNKLNKLHFKEGAKIEARDHLGDRWWDAKVVEVDASCDEVLVHFIGWNERHDEWIRMDSPRLQPATRKTRRSGNNGEGGAGGGGGGTPGPSNSPKEFKTGEEVMASWKNIKYPAKILRFEPDGSYMVEYYDGVKKKIRPNGLRRISVEDQPFIKSVKLDLEELLSRTPLNGSSPAGDHQAAGAGGTPDTGGRRRKSKFNVKEILNICDRKTGLSSNNGNSNSESSDRRKAASGGAASTGSPSSASVSVSSSPASSRTSSPQSSRSVAGPASLPSHLLESGSSLSDSVFENPPSDPRPADDCRNFKRPPAGDDKSSAAVDHPEPDKSSLSKENVEHSINCDNLKPRPSSPVTPVNGFDPAAGNSPEPAAVAASAGAVDLLDLPAESSSESMDTGSEGTPSEKENLPAANLINTKEANAAAAAVAAAISDIKGSVARVKKAAAVKESLPAAAGDGGGLLGKRSRKRKRWPDEEPELPGKKKTGSGGRPTAAAGTRGRPPLPELNTSIAKSKSNRVLKVGSEGVSPSVLSPKKKTTSGGLEAAKPASPKQQPKQQPPVVSKSLSSMGSATAAAKPAHHAGGAPARKKTSESLSSSSSSLISSSSPSSSFPYLNFNFELPPADLVASIVEGVNVPAIGQPITMRAPKLPAGWSKVAYVRSRGTSMGNWDVYILGPNQKKSFRSKGELSRYFEANNIELSVEDFDFVLDPQLKKIRTIWKEHLKSKASFPFSEAKDGKEAKKEEEGTRLLHPLVKGIPYELMGQGLESAPAQPSTPATPELPPPPTTNGVESTALAALSSPPPATSKPKSSPTPLPQKSVITRSEAPTTPPMSSPGGTAASSLPGHSPTAAGVEERGVRCNLTDCNKLFRSENLLLQHVKHAHKPVSLIVEKSLGNTPTVIDLAYHNTRVGDKAKDLVETDGGELLDILKKAEKKFERQKSSPASATRRSRAGRLVGRASGGQATEPQPSPPGKLTDLPPSQTGLSEKAKKRKISPVGKDEKKVCGPLPATSLDPSESEPLVVALPTPLTPGVTSNTSDPPPTPEPLKAVVGGAPTLPSTPLTSDVKRTKSRVKRSSLHESMQTEPVPPAVSTSTLEEPASPQAPKKGALLSPVTPPASSSAETAGGGSTPPTWKRRPVRSPPEEGGVETMSEEEVVHCVCGRAEGDGLMLQCDVCLTWQHGLCLAIFSEDQVPDKYMCSYCQEPRLGRQSTLYRNPQHWLLASAGALPSLGEPLMAASDSVDRLGTLTALVSDLTALSGLLHSLQLKLHIAEQTNHPKVFMWSSPWESPSSSSSPDPTSAGQPDLAASPPDLSGAWDAESSFLNLDLPFPDSDLVPGSSDLVSSSGNSSGGGSNDLTAAKNASGPEASSSRYPEHATINPDSNPSSSRRDEGQANFLTDSGMTASRGGDDQANLSKQPAVQDEMDDGSDQRLLDSSIDAAGRSGGKAAGSGGGQAAGGGGGKATEGSVGHAAGSGGGIATEGSVGQAAEGGGGQTSEDGGGQAAEGDVGQAAAVGDNSKTTDTDTKLSNNDKDSQSSSKECGSAFDLSSTVSGESQTAASDQAHSSGKPQQEAGDGSVVNQSAESSIADQLTYSAVSTSNNSNDFDKPGASAATTAEDFSFDSFDIPSLSEVQQLLPGVLKELDLPPPLAGSLPSATSAAANLPPPANNQLPEAPKLIDREESKANLVHHVEHMQNLIEERLNLIEAAVVEVETTPAAADGSGHAPTLSAAENCASINRGLARLLQDLRNIKTISNLMPERL